MPSKNYGLKLTLGGAPATPHVLAGIPGFFRPDVATPVGEDCPISVERARELAKDKGVELELVELSAGDFKAAKEQAHRDVNAAQRNLRDAARVAEGAEISRAADEGKAVKAAK